MKAFLLAAGLGTRLKPVTDKIPKCLVHVCGIPLLDWWIKLFELHNVKEVLINLHHLPEKIISFISNHDTKIHFQFYYEDNLLGSAGTLKANKRFVEKEKQFFVCYADNLTNYNLSDFLSFYLKKKKSAAMALYTTDTPTMKGIVELDSEQIVKSFEEKPALPKSNLANAGIYLFKPEVLDLIPDYKLADIGYHLLPKLIGNMCGWESKDFLMDIGTHAHLSLAEKKWKQIIKGN